MFEKKLSEKEMIGKWGTVGCGEYGFGKLRPTSFTMKKIACQVFRHTQSLHLSIFLGKKQQPLSRVFLYDHKIN